MNVMDRENTHETVAYKLNHHNEPQQTPLNPMPRCHSFSFTSGPFIYLFCFSFKAIFSKMFGKTTPYAWQNNFFFLYSIMYFLFLVIYVYFPRIL